MVLHDYFSGIGGFRLGLENAGFTFDKSCFSEIDKHAIANYKYNFKNDDYIGTIEHVCREGIAKPDIITFGSPCQDFSIAGQRAGLAGNKSSLIEHALSAISHYRPDVFIWENVKGTFSSNAGADFWAIIKAFADIGGYGLEWQLVNTSWLLPQNRERIYLVGHSATAFPNWKGIFPVGENDGFDTPKTESNKEQFQTEVCSAIRTGYGTKGNETYVIVRGHGFVNDSVTDVCPTIRSSSFENNCFIYNEDCLRKFTEIECERLHGYPDDWTKYGNYNGNIRNVPQTQRYKMLGNTVTAKMVELIGKRIKANYNIQTISN